MALTLAMLLMAPVPGSEFGSGLAGWTVPEASRERVRAVLVHDGPADHAVLIDGRLESGPSLAGQSEVGLHSEPFPVEPMTHYELSGMVRRLEGDGQFKLSLEWRDEDGRHLGYENSWSGLLVGDRWERHDARFVSPAQARSARILLGVRPREAAYMTSLALTPVAPLGPRLAIDIYPDPCTQHAPYSLPIRIENRGDVLLDDLRATVSLPPGIRAVGREALTFDIPSLGHGEHFLHRIEVEGLPRDADQPIRCEVAATADGEGVLFSAETPPFTVRSQAERRSFEDVPPLDPPATPVKLGCYYFPVTLDWDRSGWGVRKVDYLNPLLGYYDESRPEVADWHIRWAREAGISFFVFDWYYNQDCFYLNDALEKGFLGSQLADEMEFCIDWCNEGHCQEFKPLDFSQQALDQFMRVLCERYLHRENYLRANGWPVVLIHQPWRIATAHGGWEGCAAALEGMRKVARGYGHPGIFFVAVQNSPEIMPFGRGGYDAVTAYAYGFAGVPWGGPDRSLPYEALLPRHRECFEEASRRAEEQGIGYIPSGWIGWDDAGRSKERAVRTVGNTPAAFRRMVQALPQAADPSLSLALFEAWNEWGEGGAAEPGIRHGFGYLDAIRDALTDDSGARTVYRPPAEDVASWETDITWSALNDEYWSRTARSLGLHQGVDMRFESQGSLWLRPGHDTSQVRIEDGALRGIATGPDPSLIGPPAMGLPAQDVDAIEIEMAFESEEGDEVELTLYWSTWEERKFAEERSFRARMRADGSVQRLAFAVGEHRSWEGLIYQLRLDPAEAPGRFAIDRLATLPRS